MKKVLWLWYTLIVLPPLMLVAESPEHYDPITNPLYEEMERVKDDEFIRINIVLKDQFDTRNLYSIASAKGKVERREFVIQTLKQFSQDKQAGLLADLQSYSKNQLVKNVQSLWIANVITCSVTPAIIQNIAKRDDILQIDHDELRKMIFDEKQPIELIQKTTSRDGREITWNVTLVNADDVWALGYTGSGALVSVIDTGVNHNHQDLQSHMWNGGLFYPNHGYDFSNNDNDPMDDHGHGTHCAGTVAGDGTAGSQTGMAPDAAIMAIKVLDENGNGFESDVWEAIEFSVEYNADIMSISLGWMHDWSPNRTAWRNAMDNALSAGVIAAVAAANAGSDTWSYPIPDNVATPGDCPPPWPHPDQTLTGGQSAVVCVGATNSNDVIAGFSSRGPVTWENVSSFNDYPYDPEMGLIRPDLTAPGVNIKSLAHYSNTGYESGWDGTSMATPCVAGVMALMISKEPSLTPEQISQYLEETALHLGSTGKNNNYGSGRVDALEAINAIFISPVPPNQVYSPIPADQDVFATVGTNLSWRNGGGATSYRVYFGTDNPPTNIVNGETVNVSSFSSLPTLDYSSVYFWKIDAVNDYGTTEGLVWSFTTLSPADEDFETGDFTLYPWSFNGNLDWVVESSDPFSGNYSVKSGNIGSDQTSSLLLAINVSVESELSFWKKVSCEDDVNNNYDYLAFYIDNVELGRWDGEVSWSQEVYTVGAGSHTLEWKYLKDGLVDGGDDAAWIDYITFPSQFVEISTSQISNWNIVGTPVWTDDPAVSTIYPASLSNTCYGFGQEGYFLTNELSEGFGYWLRFENSGTTPVIGNPINEITLSLMEGWNLISGASFETSITTILDPDNILVPNTAYGFSITGYYNTGELVPGQGYWIRSTTEGQITVSASSALQTSSVLYEGNKNTNAIPSNILRVNGFPLYFGFELSEREILSYSLPPKPPAGAFDVRFTGDMKYSETGGKIEVMNHSDAIQIEYHILPSEDWKLTGRGIEEVILSGDGVMEISRNLTEFNLEKVSSLPIDYSLHQNYPNPFNPSTTIAFSIPFTETEGQDVLLQIFDVRGRLVRTLMEGSLNSGNHTVVWNGKDSDGYSVASGMYLYQLSTPAFISTKKLVLLK